MTHKNAASLETSHSKVIVEHCDIIKPDFWEAHPSILNEKPPTFWSTDSQFFLPTWINLLEKFHCHYSCILYEYEVLIITYKKK